VPNRCLLIVRKFRNDSFIIFKKCSGRGQKKPPTLVLVGLKKTVKTKIYSTAHRKIDKKPIRQLHQKFLLLITEQNRTEQKRILSVLNAKMLIYC